jgi:hypothetical protein
MTRSATYAFGILACLTLPAPCAGAEAGRIKVSTGPVHIERGGQRLAAPVDTIVEPADTIVTGSNATVGVTFSDNTRIAAGPNSVLTIDRYAFDQTTHAGTFDAAVKRGTLAVASGKIAKQNPQSVRVRSPSFLLGVRGTEFVVYAGE